MSLSDSHSESTFDLVLSSGRIRARRVGPANAPLVLLIHGLSAHMHSFDFIIDQLAAPDRQLVAVDLRGRGQSDITPDGSYGLHAHCRDVLEMASLLGAGQFDLIGWSMGALIGIAIASRAPQRLRRLILIDHAGKMDPGPIEKINKGLDRLQIVVDQPSDYINAIRLGGSISPWNSFWEHYYAYELGPCQDGYRATTSKAACLEDLHSLRSENFESMWPSITMPAMLVRCELPVGGGFIVPANELDKIRQAVPHLQIVRAAGDHYTVMVDPQTAAAMKAFLAHN